MIFLPAHREIDFHSTPGSTDLRDEVLREMLRVTKQMTVHINDHVCLCGYDFIFRSLPYVPFFCFRRPASWKKPVVYLAARCILLVCREAFRAINRARITDTPMPAAASLVMAISARTYV